MAERSIRSRTIEPANPGTEQRDPSRGGGRHPAHVEPATRILVVEDDWLNQTVAVHLLNKLGYHADVAVNGREAVEAVAHRAYAAVLMDCQMPELDGFAATAEIRAHEALRQAAGPTTGRPARLPIIAFTANTTPEDRQRCLAAGMDDYIPKPADAHDMQMILQRWIRTPPYPGSRAR